MPILFQLLYVKWSEVAQSCLTLCDPMDCSLPGSTIRRIFQARILELVAISFSRRSSWPRDWTQVSHMVGIVGRGFYHLSNQGRSEVHGIKRSQKWKCEGFPGGSVVKKPLANAGERSHFLIQEDPHASEQLSPCATTIEPVLWSPGASPTEPACCNNQSSHRVHAPQQEKPLQWEAHAPQLESSPLSLQLEKSLNGNKDPRQPKINN